MTVLTLRQVIFTRVEPAYSPNRNSGFQVVYSSKSLSRDEVEEIKKRVEGFYVPPPALPPSSVPPPTRAQFHILKSGAAMMAKTVVLETDREILDKESRYGVFLAHVFIADATSFGLVYNNPFAVLDNAPFITTTDQFRNIIAEYGQGTGTAPEITVYAQSSLASMHSWSADEFSKLASLAEGAEALRATSKTLQIVGSQDEILEAIRAAMIATRNRRDCTFDSNIDRVSIPSGQRYWAVGVPEKKGGSQYVLVNARERRVITDLASILPPTPPPYRVWSETMIATGRADAIPAMSTTVMMLAEHLDNTTPLSPNEIVQIENQQEAASSFIEVHSVRINEMVLAAVGRVGKLSEVLTTVITKYFTQKVLPADTLDVALRGEIEYYRLADAFFQMMKDSFVLGSESLSKDDWLNLLQLARRAQHAPLQFWVALFIDSDAPEDAAGFEKDRLEALSNMSRKQFPLVMSRLMQPFPPHHFIGKAGDNNNLNLLIETVASNQMDISEPDFADLIKRLGEVNRGDLLDKLIYRVGRLPADWTEYLREQASSIPGAAPEFVNALELRRLALDSLEPRDYNASRWQEGNPTLGTQDMPQPNSPYGKMGDGSPRGNPPPLPKQRYRDDRTHLITPPPSPRQEKDEPRRDPNEWRSRRSDKDI